MLQVQEALADSNRYSTPERLRAQWLNHFSCTPVCQDSGLNRKATQPVDLVRPEEQVETMVRVKTMGRASCLLCTVPVMLLPSFVDRRLCPKPSCQLVILA